MASDCVIFCIALLSKRTALNWDRVLHQLGATLQSVYRQTDQRFRILVACNEVPELPFPVDDRLEFLVVPDEPARSTYAAFNEDSTKKRHLIARRARELGGGYLMMLDADDLVSNRLVRFVLETRHPLGYLITAGYALDVRTAALAPFPLAAYDLTYDRICGSCAIIRYAEEDLPASSSDCSCRFAQVLTGGHQNIRDYFQGDRGTLLDLPFRAGVYVRNNGEAVSTRVDPDGVASPYADYHTGLVRRTNERAVPLSEQLAAEFQLGAAVFPEVRRLVPEWSRPGLSVVVATHNRPEGLERLLTALRSQVAGHPDREIVVANDGTHDERYARVVDRFRGLISYRPLEVNGGTAIARNASCASARFDYLVFTDDDCEPRPAWLDWLTARLMSYPDVDVVGGGTEPLWHDRRSFWDRVQAHHRLLPNPERDGADHLFVTACFCVRRDLFEAADGFLEHPTFRRAGEDTELSVRLRRGNARQKVDGSWSVRHELGTLRQYWRRYWHYGFINTTALDLMTSPASLQSQRHARRGLHWRHAVQSFRRELKKAEGFSDRRAVNLLAALAATTVRVAYYDGCAQGAKVLAKASHGGRRPSMAKPTLESSKAPY